MTLDKVIASLNEAKEHCVDGRTEILVTESNIVKYYIRNIVFNSSVMIEIEEV